MASVDGMLARDNPVSSSSNTPAPVPTDNWDDLPPIPTPHDVSDLLIPPLNFALVRSGVYRSGYPDKKNFPFLKKLKLHKILNLSSVEYYAETKAFFEQNNIAYQQLPFGDNKEPFQDIPAEPVKEGLRQVMRAFSFFLIVLVIMMPLDTLIAVADKNRPILVHCAKGTHRTGCLVGCLRKSEKWLLTAIFDEYRRFAGTKVRLLDQQFIELFDPRADLRLMKKDGPEDSSFAEKLS